jgi:hypothetical protein
MNRREREMLDMLKALKQDFGASAVKAEFEAEGTRIEELMRLIDLARRADLKVKLKIGGCEAVRDLIESKQFGVEYIIAPMTETPYSVEKFILAKAGSASKPLKLKFRFTLNLNFLSNAFEQSSAAKTSSLSLSCFSSACVNESFACRCFDFARNIIASFSNKCS